MPLAFQAPWKAIGAIGRVGGGLHADKECTSPWHVYFFFRRVEYTVTFFPQKANLMEASSQLRSLLPWSCCQ